MEAAILTIGDEILMGQITDTNSAYIARMLTETGIRTGEICSIADHPEAIVRALDRLLPEHDLILITGGLGSTKDDLTKKTLADYFNDRLVFHETTYARIERMLSGRGIMNKLNRSQAFLPEKARILANLKGTANGMWFEKDGKTVISLPGVPFEMEYLMQSEVLPSLKQRYPQSNVDFRLFIVYNIAESILAEHLDGFEQQMPEGIGLAYLPSPGLVKLRITATESGLAVLEQQAAVLENRLRELSFPFISVSDSQPDIETRIGNLLRQKGSTLSTAESCTGGYLAHLITSIPGSSAYYKGSIIAYSNEIKQSLLDVPARTLQQEGTVSEATVKAMAEGAQKKFGTDYAIATSGIAGPDGGSMEKPVGTVWIAIASPQDILAKCFHFSLNRERNIARTSIQALCWLAEIIQR